MTEKVLNTNPFALEVATDTGTTTNEPRRTAYQRAIDTLMWHLEQGVAPWKTSFIGINASPFKPAIGNEDPVYYSGSNIMFCWMHMLRHGWTDPRFATFDDAKKYGKSIGQDCSVMGKPDSWEGPYGVPCIRWGKDVDKFKPKNDDGTTNYYWFAKTFTLFNLEAQTDLELPALALHTDGDPTPIADLEFLFETSGAKLVSGVRPAYQFKKDQITMPKRESYESPLAYDIDRMHELVHWTGVKDRLDRPEYGSTDMNSESYSQEELTAEIGATFILSRLGIEQSEASTANSAAYIKGWSEKLTAEPGMFVAATSKAAAAVDYLFDLRATALLAKAA